MESSYETRIVRAVNMLARLNPPRYLVVGVDPSVADCEQYATVPQDESRREREDIAWFASLDDACQHARPQNN